MRTFLGIVLVILGIPILLAGAVTATLVGTDDTVDVLTQDVSTDSAALVVPSSVVGLAGPTLVVTAEAEGADTFVGAGHPVHVASFLGGAASAEVTDVTRSLDLTVRDVPATDVEAAVPPPADLDWWQERSVGSGPQTVDVDLTEEPVSVVVTAAEPAAPLSVTVTGAVRLDNLFTTTIVIGAVGLVLVILGILAMRSGRRTKRARATTASSEPAPASPPETPLPSPAPSPPSRGRRRARRVLGIVVPATVLVTGGCASIPETVESRSTALVAATTEQNGDFFAHYTAANNNANAAQDPRAVAAVETGPLLTASEFGFQVEKAQGLEPTQPFTISPTALAAPQFESYPLFYLASAIKGDQGSAHYLLTRTTAVEPWKAAAVVDLPDEQAFDLVATVGEHPATADDATIESGVAALDLVRILAETGKPPEGLTADAAQSIADLSKLGFTADPNAEGIDTLSRTCEVAPAADGAWVTTETNGTLTIAAVTCTQQLRTTEGFWFTPDRDYGTIKGGTDLTATTVTGVVPFIAEVSASGTVVARSGNLSLTRTDAVTR